DAPTTPIQETESMITDQERYAIDDRSHKDGFYDGVILALQIMTGGGNAFNAEYVELLKCAGVRETVERSLQEGMYEMAGFDHSDYACVDMRKEINAVRREFIKRSTPFVANQNS